VLFFQILQVPGADLEKVGNLRAGEKPVSHGLMPSRNLSQPSGVNLHGILFTAHP
jgi:hypothetical protein